MRTGGRRTSVASITSNAARCIALSTTFKGDERQLAQHFLLYLSSNTFEDATGLQDELSTALDDGTSLLLVHELREGRGALPFGAIIERTPLALLQRGIYNSLAVPLYDGEDYLRAGLRVVLSSISPHSDMPSKAQQLTTWLKARRVSFFNALRLPRSTRFKSDEVVSNKLIEMSAPGENLLVQSGKI